MLPGCCCTTRRSTQNRMQPEETRRASLSGVDRIPPWATRRRHLEQLYRAHDHGDGSRESRKTDPSQVPVAATSTSTQGSQPRRSFPNNLRRKALIIHMTGRRDAEVRGRKRRKSSDRPGQDAKGPLNLSLNRSSTLVPSRAHCFPAFHFACPFGSSVPGRTWPSLTRPGVACSLTC